MDAAELAIVRRFADERCGGLAGYVAFCEQQIAQQTAKMECLDQDDPRRGILISDICGWMRDKRECAALLAMEEAA